MASVLQSFHALMAISATRKLQLRFLHLRTSFERCFLLRANSGSVVICPCLQEGFSDGNDFARTSSAPRIWCRCVFFKPLCWRFVGDIGSVYQRPALGCLSQTPQRSELPRLLVAVPLVSCSPAFPFGFRIAYGFIHTRTGLSAAISFKASRSILNPHFSVKRVFISLFFQFFVDMFSFAPFCRDSL